MKTGLLNAIPLASLIFNLALAMPGPSGRKLEARQDIDFNLVDSTPDPIISPEGTSKFNPSTAVTSVSAAVTASPLPQSKRSLEARAIVVNTHAGYTANVPIGNAAIYAPLDYNKHDTYMGAKLFASTAFDTALCAAACSAQSAYNLRHPPVNSPAQTCQFYNTYALHKNNVYQGQYCSLYDQIWNATYATNTGQYRGSDHYTIQYSYISSNATNSRQLQQAETRTPLDLTATTFSSYGPVNVQTIFEKNLVSFHFENPPRDYYYLQASIPLPVIANQIYEISFDYFQEVTSKANSRNTVIVRDDDGDGFQGFISWRQYDRPSTEPGVSLSFDGGVDPCWKDKVMPQTTPASGVWNTGKLILKPMTNSAVFRWDFGDIGETHGVQWKNLYVTKLPADYCSSGQ